MEDAKEQGWLLIAKEDAQRFSRENKLERAVGVGEAAREEIPDATGSIPRLHAELVQVDCLAEDMPREADGRALASVRASDGYGRHGDVVHEIDLTRAENRAVRVDVARESRGTTWLFQKAGDDRAK